MRAIPRPRRLLLPLLVLLVPAADPAGPPAPPGHVSTGAAAADSLVAEWVEAERIPGAVLLVVRDGMVELERAYGRAQLYEYGDGQYGWEEPGRLADIRRLDDPRPMTPGTAFDLASVTKVLATTLALMDLAGQGRVDVDAPVGRYLPDFGGGPKDSVTLRHLLTHRSGLPQWLPVYYHASDPEAAYRYVRDRPLEWPVGQGRHYSDLGFMLLGRVVEEVAGEPLDRYLAARFYGPLGLEATGFRRRGGSRGDGAPGGAASPPAGPPPLPAPAVAAATSHGNPYEHRMVHDTAFGYRIEGDAEAWSGWRRRTLVGEVNDGNAWHAFGGVAGHAGLFSTAREAGVLLQLLLNRGTYGGERYLEASAVEAFLAPVTDGQALGWQVPGYAPEGSFSHTGFTGTFVLGVPERDFAVVLLTNRQNGGVDEGTRYPGVGALQRGVAEALLR